MSTFHIKCFMKFGQEEHIKDLFKNGTIYMNSIQSFRTIEDNFTRGDLYEGISKLHNYPPGEFHIKELNYTGKYESLQLRESFEEVIGNIYCLYCVSSFHIENPLDFRIDPKNLNFGSHCLFIKDNPEFLNRITNRLKLLGLKFRHGFVEYYDKYCKTGEVTLFQKPNEYKYQNEFRIYVQRPSTLPLMFQIGSLAEIAEIYRAEELINGLTLNRVKSK